MALDIAAGLAYLAEQKYVHRDIACRWEGRGGEGAGVGVRSGVGAVMGTGGGAK